MNHRTLALAGLLLLSGCGAPAAEPPAAPTVTTAVTSAAPRPRGLPTAPPVDRHDPASVAEAALKTMWSQDATTDHGPQDAMLRAVPLMEPSFAEKVRKQPGRGGSSWMALKDYRGYTTVILTKDAAERIAEEHHAVASPVGVTKVLRVMQIRSQGEQGWASATTSSVVVELKQSADGTWAVNGYA